MLNICLVNPEIPQNTGNIARTAAIVGANLHLIEPLGFDISQKAVKRSGLDYWDKVNIIVHKSFNEFKRYLSMQDDAEVYLLTTKAQKVYSDIKYNSNKNIYLVFGPESRGLDEQYILDNMKNAIRIPMRDTLRSLNLSNSVAIAVYEVLRQNNFDNLEQTSTYFKKENI